MDEKKLIKMLKIKNKEALGFLIENYSGILNSVISRILSDLPYLQEEALNDAIFAVWENIGSFDPHRSTFKNWCASVARYKAIDALRKEVKHNCLELVEEIQGYSEEEFTKLLVKEIFSYLSKEDRELFTLLFLEGLTYDELSEALKVSKNSLYSRVKRIRKKLFEEFNGG